MAVPKITELFTYLDQIKKTFVDKPKKYMRLQVLWKIYLDKEISYTELLENLGGLLKEETSLLEGFNRLLPPDIQISANHLKRKHEETSSHDGDVVCCSYNEEMYRVVGKKVCREEDILKHGTFEDLQFFDKVTNLLGNSQSITNFYQLINLFNQHHITPLQLLHYARPFISSPLLFSQLRRMLRKQLRVHQGLKSHRQHPLDSHVDHKKYEIDFSSSCKLGSSYRYLGEQEERCSGRDALCNEVLNDDWVCFPLWSNDCISTSESLGVCKLSSIEEFMHKCEDGRFELDIVIDSVSSTYDVLQAVNEKMKNMSHDQISEFRLDDCLGGSSAVLQRRSIERIYGDRCHDFIEGLKTKPFIGVPIALRRMKLKLNEWKEERKRFNEVWREQLVRQQQRWNNCELSSLKQTSQNSLKSKVVINQMEAMQAESEQLEKVYGPMNMMRGQLFNYNLNNKSRNKNIKNKQLLLEHVSAVLLKHASLKDKSVLIVALCTIPLLQRLVADGGNGGVGVGEKDDDGEKREKDSGGDGEKGGGSGGNRVDDSCKATTAKDDDKDFKDGGDFVDNDSGKVVGCGAAKGGKDADENNYGVKKKIKTEIDEEKKKETEKVAKEEAYSLAVNRPRRSGSIAEEEPVNKYKKMRLKVNPSEEIVMYQGSRFYYILFLHHKLYESLSEVEKIADELEKGDEDDEEEEDENDSNDNDDDQKKKKPQTTVRKRRLNKRSAAVKKVVKKQGAKEAKNNEGNTQKSKTLNNKNLKKTFVTPGGKTEHSIFSLTTSWLMEGECNEEQFKKSLTCDVTFSQHDVKTRILVLISTINRAVQFFIRELQIVTSDESCKTLLQLFEKTYLCNNNNGEVVNNEAFKMADESHYRHQSIKKLANDYVFKITFKDGVVRSEIEDYDEDGDDDLLISRYGNYGDVTNGKSSTDEKTRCDKRIRISKIVSDKDDEGSNVGSEDRNNNKANNNDDIEKDSDKWGDYVSSVSKHEEEEEEDDDDDSVVDKRSREENESVVSDKKISQNGGVECGEGVEKDGRVVGSRKVLEEVKKQHYLHHFIHDNSHNCYPPFLPRNLRRRRTTGDVLINDQQECYIPHGCYKIEYIAHKEFVCYRIKNNKNKWKQ